MMLQHMHVTHAWQFLCLLASFMLGYMHASSYYCTATTYTVTWMTSTFSKKKQHGIHGRHAFEKLTHKLHLISGYSPFSALWILTQTILSKDWKIDHCALWENTEFGEWGKLCKYMHGAGSGICEFSGGLLVVEQVEYCWILLSRLKEVKATYKINVLLCTDEWQFAKQSDQ